jgi:hypothetical protein
LLKIPIADYRGIGGSYFTLSSLSCLPWFSRVWTLQEALLPNDASVYFNWGSETISLRTFVAGIEGRISLLKQKSEVAFFSTHRFINLYIDTYRKDLESKNQGTRAGQADSDLTPGSSKSLSYAEKVKLRYGRRWKYKPLYTVYDILNRARHLDSTDPRDKIYVMITLEANRASITEEILMLRNRIPALQGVQNGTLERHHIVDISIR